MKCLKMKCVTKLNVLKRTVFKIKFVSKSNVSENQMFTNIKFIKKSNVSICKNVSQN